MEVLSHYYSHGKHRCKTYEKFGISKTNLRMWFQTYRIDKESVSLQSELEKAMRKKHLQISLFQSFAHQTTKKSNDVDSVDGGND